MIKRVLSIISIAFVTLLASLIFYSTYVRRVKLSKTIPISDTTREAKVLTAFFGLDNSLPLQATLLYYKAMGKDGMPIVFSQEIDPLSLNNQYFEVITSNNEIFEVEYVTLKPANEEFELRTVLLIGEYGNHPENPPDSVRITGDLQSRSGQSYMGQAVKVIPLPEGPIISYAEYFIIDKDYPYLKSGGGCDCPRSETEMVIRTVWSGGVRAVNGKELGDNELDEFQVTVVQGSDTVKVTPFKLADLNDNDNNLDLCLKVNGVPIFIEADAGIAIDPRGDLNPQTHMEIHSRW